ncbi:hypothetical protein LC609_25245 [Nostoc sp. XA013]|uniref:Uncharacterized protein n=1 Tax=Nostoc flagelliforme FACHB-838 TaxID=2692904 RepID=A0ABR8E4B5_9NOSO|nr:hypothetical protein [Nostoc flagelliforme]MBD2535439.1 hypothetical protein [Nostoc flagelliforme FACHB-838]MCC5653047.1 hypothetical protein [Nostoc sp. XA013]
MARQLNQIDIFAQKLIEELPPNQRSYPGEMYYVSTGVRLIERQLQEYFQGTGVTPPNKTAVRNWFYYGCPDWAIAVLHHALNQHIVA